MIRKLILRPGVAGILIMGVSLYVWYLFVSIAVQLLTMMTF